MKFLFLFVLLIALTLAALITQDLLPPLIILKHTHILLVPVFFTYGALVLPFPAMLALAIFTGVITDLSIFQIVNGKIEIGLGCSTIIYALLGVLMQGFRKAFLRGAWWIHPPLSALCTFAVLTLQYILLSFHRESIVFNETVAWKILVPTIIAFLLSPLIEILFILIERILPYTSEEN